MEWSALHILFFATLASVFSRQYRLPALLVGAVTGANLWAQPLIHEVAGNVGQFYIFGVTDALTAFALILMARKGWAPKTAYLTAATLSGFILINMIITIKIRMHIHGSVSWYHVSIMMLNLAEAFTFIGGVLDGLANITRGLRLALAEIVAPGSVSRSRGARHSRIRRW